MNVLFLTKYSQMGASSRYRFFQYYPYLEANGITCTTQALFEDHYLQDLYEGKRRPSTVLSAFRERWLALRGHRRFDLIVLEKELFPYIPSFLEQPFARINVPYVVDYDDAIFHQYGIHRNLAVRILLKNKISNVMRAASMVLAGNDYLAEYAAKSGAQSVKTIPTVIDLCRHSIRPVKQQRDFIIGWLGSPTTAKYLQDIAPVLAEICMTGNTRVRLIGSGPVDLPGVNVEILPWCEKTEVELMHSFDVGIMPLPEEAWARGKCGFKLIQYMACGLPVIGSPVGVNQEIITPGINGYLAKNPGEWLQAFKKLKGEVALSHRLGLEGRKRVEEKYCLEVTAPRMIEALQLASRGLS